MIIAVKENDRVVIAHTNVDNWCKLTFPDYIDEENRTLKISDDGSIYGFAEMNRVSDMFLYDDEFIATEINSKSIVKTLIPYMKKKLLNAGRDISEGLGNALIICKNDHIYSINTEFEFFEFSEYKVFGYDKNICTSVLDATVGLPARERIVKAISFVGKLSNGNFFPVVITDTKDKKFEVITNGEI